MPSPIFHSVAGYAITRLPFAQRHLPGRWLTAVPLAIPYGVLVANLPDLDFLPQIMTGYRFHRGPSHSLFAAVVVSAILALLVYGFRHRLGCRRAAYHLIFALTLGIYSSHLLCDWLTVGGDGIPVFWPLTDRPFQSPWLIFAPVRHDRGFLDPSHLVFITLELLYALGLLTGLKWARGRSLGRRWQNFPLQAASAIKRVTKF